MKRPSSGSTAGEARSQDGVLGGVVGMDTEVGRLRRRLQVSRKALACLVGVHVQSVVRWETLPDQHQPGSIQAVVLRALDRVIEGSGESEAKSIVLTAADDLPGALSRLFHLDHAAHREVA